MPTVEISLPDHVESELTRLVEQGDFINRDQAVEELLAMGVSAYDTPSSDVSQTEEQMFSNVVEDQQDPAMQTDPDGDDYSF